MSIKIYDGFVRAAIDGAIYRHEVTRVTLQNPAVDAPGYKKL